MKQKDIFLESEGNAWLERNRDKLGQSDPVSDILDEARNQGITVTNVLEVGCANGWRLAKLRDKYGCEVTGIEPSLRACVEAAELKVPVIHGTASMLPFAPETFDLIIFGFCLYLTDWSDWFRIAAEADTVLRDGGHIIIHDFDNKDEHFAVKYEHCDGVLAHHYRFGELWLSHPNYSQTWWSWNDGELVEVIQKGRDAVWIRP